MFSTTTPLDSSSETKLSNKTLTSNLSFLKILTGTPIPIFNKLPLLGKAQAYPLSAETLISNISVLSSNISK